MRFSNDGQCLRCGHGVANVMLPCPRCSYAPCAMASVRGCLVVPVIVGIALCLASMFVKRTLPWWLLLSSVVGAPLAGIVIGPQLYIWWWRRV